MQRYDYLKAIAQDAGDALVVVAHAAREWNAVRPGDWNFRIRTLGLTSSTALGVALGLPHRKVIAIDGDGAFLMNLCGLPTIAQQNPKNLIHLLFDNQCYETAGGGATATATVADAVTLAKGAGYRNACWVEGPEQFRQEFRRALERNELCLIAAKVKSGRPEPFSFPIDEVENKYRFIRYIEATEKRSILPIADHAAGTVRFSPPPLSTGAVMNPGESAKIIIEALKKAAVNLVTTLPDRKYAELVDAISQDPFFKNVPLCREEEGIGICTGAYLAGMKPALIMQNGGLLNSCNALATMALQSEIPILLLVYYAGDIGDRGFATLGAVTEPVLQGMGIRSYTLSKLSKAEETLVGARVLAEDYRRPVAVLLTKAVLGAMYTSSSSSIPGGGDRLLPKDYAGRY